VQCAVRRGRFALQQLQQLLVPTTMATGRQLRGLGQAIAGVEAARAALEAETLRVSEQLDALRESVLDSNAEVSRHRRSIEGEQRKRCRHTSRDVPPGPVPHGDGEATEAQDEAAFNVAVGTVEEQLHSHRRALARTHHEVQLLQASVGAVLTRAAPLCGAGRHAAAKEARNEECNALVRLLGVPGATHAAVLGLLSVVDLWRARRVCRAFRRWAVAQLSSMPRPVAVGGHRYERLIDARSHQGSWHAAMTAGVEALDLSTMRWSSTLCAMPPLPAHAARIGLFPTACANDDGCTVALLSHKTAVQWVPGTSDWEPLPDVDGLRWLKVLALEDGKPMVVGKERLGVHTLTDDGWTRLVPPPRTWPAPPPECRRKFSAAVLPCCGDVIVAGGKDAATGEPLKTALLWHSTTRAWTPLPDMNRRRYGAGCCVLPSGRIAVVGGRDDHHAHNDAELLDLQARTWTMVAQVLPGVGNRACPGVVSIAGGMLVVGTGIRRNSGNDTLLQSPNALFDEETEQWFQLPHPMVEPRATTCVVSVASQILDQMDG
jgi:hypothetical protein